MGQKVDPRGYRLGVTTDFRSRWYAEGNKEGQTYAEYVNEDIQIRRLITKSLSRAGISKVEIERTLDKLKIDAYFGRPGLAIGQKGSGAEKVRAQISRLTGKQVQLNILDAGNPQVDAQLVAQNIAEQLNARITFRRAMKKAIEGVMKNGGLGVKILCSGRLGGAEIARSEFYREGSVPLHTLRAYVDYGFFEAATTYGRIGVKVWIYKGELTEKEWSARQGANRQQRRNSRPARRPNDNATAASENGGASIEANVADGAASVEGAGVDVAADAPVAEVPVVDAPIDAAAENKEGDK
ncbi:MAG: 30S ribosomal protein S3 [Candidatus Ancillula sp.]|jgi:small subunit ribosomal protein S3|nr:30S ribosomal protein S3 [Candidatus Ancillula sp.]